MIHARLRTSWLAAVSAVILTIFTSRPAPGQQVNSALFTQLKYRAVGPAGNRASAVAGVPGNPLISYVGAASGGVWKTADGGVDWHPVFDHEPAQSIGALAIAPSNPSIIWAGTGETFYIRGSTSIGNGIYKSSDGGRTWKLMGLEKTGRIGRIVIDPYNANIVFAAAEGSSFGPSQDRGVYRTTDGGATWQRVLFVNPDTGAADIAMDSHDPDILLAGTWQLTIHAWNLDSGGPGSGVYISRDAGATWTRIVGHGLPTHPVGKIAVAIARSDPDRMYALIQDKEPGFYRSDDGGKSWKLVSQDHRIDERPPYYTRFVVDPADENRIYFVTTFIMVSLDGGVTLQPRPLGGGGDNHDFWIDPTNPDRMMIAHDGGASITLNRGKTWQHIVLPIAQMYHVYADNNIPYFLYGNRQDGDSYRIASNSRAGGIDPWTPISVGGCESGFAVPDPSNSDIVWSGCYDGGLDRFDLRTLQTRDVRVWPVAAYGWPPAQVKYRWNWTFPIAISPHNSNAVYVGSQYVHETTDGGQSWKVISPDLTRNDQAHEQNSGGVSYDNLMTFDGATLWSIAVSPLKQGLIWTGSNDGLVHVTRDDGAHWTDVTQNISGLPPWSTIMVEPSHFHAGTAYIAADLHVQNDSSPYIFKSDDYGATWKLISTAIPKSVFSYVHCVIEDPSRQGMLYAGTENSVYVSLDDGAHWTLLQSNLPHAPAEWLALQPGFADLLVGTYGRGIWILDDITPLRQLNSSVLSAPLHLFPPRPAYRFRNVVPAPDQPFGTRSNPPYGADINYYLKDATKGPVKIVILASGGQPIRTLKGTGKAGINRIWWDLRYEPATQPKLITSPPGDAWLTTTLEGCRVRTWDLDLSTRGPQAAPGTYIVRLTVGKQSMSQPLNVLKDPHSAGTPQDIHAQVKLSLQIRDSLDATAKLIDQTEWVRRQLHELSVMIQPDPRHATVAKAAAQLTQKNLTVEGDLFDLHLAGAREDAFRNPMRLFGRFSALNRDVTDSSADFAPTDQQLAAYQFLAGNLRADEAAFHQLVSQDIVAFNRLLQKNNLGGISVPQVFPKFMPAGPRFFGSPHPNGQSQPSEE
jgi:photosystem II stability/assembly factor-like uncharacterized protein